MPKTRFKSSSHTGEVYLFGPSLDSFITFCYKLPVKETVEEMNLEKIERAMFKSML